MKRSLKFDCLENRISLSLSCDPIVTVNVPVATGVIPVPVHIYQEQDPGPLPSDNQPIIYPPSDPSGAVGPGAHFSPPLSIHATTV